jgi:hypothetical protein
VKNDPRVQQKTQHAVDTARQQAPLVADKVTSAAGAAAAKVSRPDSSEPDPQHLAGPPGDLP